jgi:hypothetical protein
MGIYQTEQDAIYGLHKKGYSNDFHLFGNDLLWIQKKIFIRAGNFSIEECHRFRHPEQEGKEVIVFGIVATKYNAKGIMLNDYASYTVKTPAVIEKKLADMYAFAG